MVSNSRHGTYERGMCHVSPTQPADAVNILTPWLTRRGDQRRSSLSDVVWFRRQINLAQRPPGHRCFAALRGTNDVARLTVRMFAPHNGRWCRWKRYLRLFTKFRWNYPTRGREMQVGQVKVAFYDRSFSSLRLRRLTAENVSIHHGGTRPWRCAGGRIRGVINI